MTQKLKFQLRNWQKSDLQNLVRYANNPKIAENMMNGFPHPYGTADGEKFLERAMGQNPAGLLAIEVEGEAAGGIGVHPQGDIYCKNAELGYWLAEPFWGKGIVTGAVREMVKYGFENFEIERIFARPFGRNKGSQRVLEKAGFQLEATLPKTIFKNGQFEDELIYAIRRG